MCEPQSCPTPEACHALEQITALTQQRHELTELVKLKTITIQLATTNLITAQAQITQLQNLLNKAGVVLMVVTDYARKYEDVPFLQGEEVLDAIQRWKDQKEITAPTNERDALANALHQQDMLKQELAAAQAREAKLRDAIAYVAPMYYDVDIIEKALALPIDTSALDMQIKAAKVAILQEALTECTYYADREVLQRMADELEKQVE